MARYSAAATKWQIRLRMNDPPGPWSAWRVFTLTNPPAHALATASASPVTSQPGGPISVITKLGIAKGLIGGTKKWEAGAAQTTVYRAHPSLHLAWESPYHEQYQWQWQLSAQPYPQGGDVAPDALIDSSPAAYGDFYIDLGKYLAAQGQAAQTPQRASAPVRADTPATRSRGPTAEASSGPGRAAGISTAAGVAPDYYVRLVPMTGSSVAAPPSNTAIAHLQEGAEPAFAAAKQAIAIEQAKQADQKAWEEANRIYSLKILGRRRCLPIRIAGAAFLL